MEHYMIGTKQILVALTLAGGVAFAEPYRDLGKVEQLTCASASGRTVVQTERSGSYHLITTVQDGALVLHDRVTTRLLVQETFPASYSYLGRTSGATYLALGQSTQDFKNFSKVRGTVHYQKGGVQYRTPVTCEVQL
jgi:hypothetical protein